MKTPLPAVAGLDLSLRHTGIATPTGDSIVLDTEGESGMDRIGHIEAEVLGWTEGAELVVVEDYAHAAVYGAHRLGELGGVVRFALWRRRTPVLLVAPAKLKKYATGNGRAGKPEIVASARERLGYTGFNPDAADAWVARAFGLAVLGFPLAKLPQTHLAALIRVTRPEPVS